MTRLQTYLLLAAMSIGTSAHATRAIDAPPPTRAAVLNAPRPEPSLQADDRASLRRGMVTDVTAKGDAVLINGSWLAVVEGRTALFQHGKPAQASVLSKGQLLNFTLAPGVADRKTLGIVYVP